MYLDDIHYLVETCLVYKIAVQLSNALVCCYTIFYMSVYYMYGCRIFFEYPQHLKSNEQNKYYMVVDIFLAPDDDVLVSV